MQVKCRSQQWGVCTQGVTATCWIPRQYPTWGSLKTLHLQHTWLRVSCWKRLPVPKIGHVSSAEKKKCPHHLWLMNTGMFEDVAQWAEPMGWDDGTSQVTGWAPRRTVAQWSGSEMSKERTRWLKLCRQWSEVGEELTSASHGNISPSCSNCALRKTAFLKHSQPRREAIHHS